MKMHVNSMLIFLGMSFILFTGYKNSAVPNPTISRYNAKLTSPVTFTLTFATAGPGDNTGTYTSSGAVEASGVCTMNVQIFGKVAAHCTQTLWSPEGNITIESNCQFSTNTGHWRIVEGTGIYENLQGTGSLVMTFAGNVVEAMYGRTN